MIRSASISILALCLLAGLAEAGRSQEAQTGQAKAGSALVNLNTATAEQLETLPGVGARTAARIVEYRQKNGAFKKVEDLMNVQGVGEKSFLRLKPLITVGAPRSERPVTQ